jgi:hypothetical protein
VPAKEMIQFSTALVIAQSSNTLPQFFTIVCHVTWAMILRGSNKALAKFGLYNLNNRRDTLCEKTYIFI